MNAAEQAVTEALANRHEIFASTAADRRIHAETLAYGAIEAIQRALRVSPVEVAEALGLEQVGWMNQASLNASENCLLHLDDDPVEHAEDVQNLFLDPVFAVLPVEENKHG